MTDHLTTRGALLARMEHRRLGEGHYLVEGWEVTRRLRPRSSGRTGKVARWYISNTFIDGGVVISRRTFTEALEWIAEQIETGDRP